jgi:hypothetical protein
LLTASPIFPLNSLDDPPRSGNRVAECCNIRRAVPRYALASFRAAKIAECVPAGRPPFLDVEDNYKALAKLRRRLVLLVHINEVGLLSSLFK